MKANLNLPEAGEGRFWNITHQPNKKATPVRIELRQSAVPSAKEPIVSLSRIIGYQDTVADEGEIRTAALKVIALASRVDEFIGVYT